MPIGRTLFVVLILIALLIYLRESEALKERREPNVTQVPEAPFQELEIQAKIRITLADGRPLPNQKLFVDGEEVSGSDSLGVIRFMVPQSAESCSVGSRRFGYQPISPTDLMNPLELVVEPESSLTLHVLVPAELSPLYSAYLSGVDYLGGDLAVLKTDVPWTLTSEGESLQTIVFNDLYPGEYSLSAAGPRTSAEKVVRVDYNGESVTVSIGATTSETAYSLVRVHGTAMVDGSPLVNSQITIESLDQWTGGRSTANPTTDKQGRFEFIAPITRSPAPGVVKASRRGHSFQSAEISASDIKVGTALVDFDFEGDVSTLRLAFPNGTPLDLGRLFVGHGGESGKSAMDWTGSGLQLDLPAGRYVGSVKDYWRFSQRSKGLRRSTSTFSFDIGDSPIAMATARIPVPRLQLRTGSKHRNQTVFVLARVDDGQWDVLDPRGPTCLLGDLPAGALVEVIAIETFPVAKVDQALISLDSDDASVSLQPEEARRKVAYKVVTQDGDLVPMNMLRLRIGDEHMAIPSSRNTYSLHAIAGMETLSECLAQADGENLVVSQFDSFGMPVYLISKFGAIELQSALARAPSGTSRNIGVLQLGGEACVCGDLPLEASIADEVVVHLVDGERISEAAQEGWFCVLLSDSRSPIRIEYRRQGITILERALSGPGSVSN